MQPNNNKVNKKYYNYNKLYKKANNNYNNKIKN